MNLKLRRGSIEAAEVIFTVFALLILVTIIGLIYGIIFPESFASPASGTVVVATLYHSADLNLNGIIVPLNSYNITVIYQGASLQTTIDCASYQSVGSHFPIRVWKYFFIFGENLELGTLPSGCITPQQGGPQ